jgi:imidazolonepropionase-like amidohydrolase
VSLKALAVGPKIQATFARASRAGVNIAFGTGARVYGHGYDAQEFEYRMEGFIIRAATVTNAMLLGLSESLGNSKANKLADIIAVEANPLQHVKTLQSVTFVMKDGVI